MMMVQRSRTWIGSAVLLLAACQGGGSDIGPRLEPLPAAKFKLQVLDDQGRGVAGAGIVIDGFGRVATGRAGRADLFAAVSGTRRVTVDGVPASAVASDRLPALSFLADFDLGQGQLSFVMRLPDSSTSAVLALTAGAQAGNATLDDTAVSGALLQILGGSAVSAGAATSIELRAGLLAADHLPGVLPVASSGTLLFSRGCFVDPPDLVISPAAALELPNDLRLANGAAAELYRLDPDTGAWADAGPAVVVNGGASLRSNAGVGRGGLYTFAVAVPQAGSITGRVLDAEGQDAGYALIRAGKACVQANGSGRFRLDDVAATWGDGSPRTVTIEARGGLFHYPSATTADITLVAGSVVDAGDIQVETTPVGNMRMQLIEEGRAYARERCVLSSQTGGMAAVTLFDDNGQAVIEDVPAGYNGFTLGHPGPITNDRVFEAQAVGFMPGGRLWQDAGAYLGENVWEPGGRNTRAQTLDRRGGGPLRDIAVVRGATANAGFVQFTREGGMVVVARDFSGRATAALHSSRDGREVYSAVSFDRPFAEHLEMPLRQAMRADIGAFDRHGLRRGTLTQANPALAHRLRSTARLSPSDWFEDVVLGEPLGSSLPTKLDPATAGGLDFAIGVATPIGQMAAVEGTSAAGVFTMTRAGIATGLQLPGGEVSQGDLPLALAADTGFLATGAASGLDAGFTSADLSVDLGLLRADNTAVDVARGLGGNHVVNGNDVTFTLPALAGSLQGDDWLLSFGAERSAGSGSVAQRSVLQFGTTSRSVPFLGVPAILTPADGATVSAAGFAVQYDVPATTSYAQLELRSSDSTTTWEWLVILHPDTRQFDFVTLPSQAPMPLVAGRTYELKLTAFRLDAGVLLQRPRPYNDLTSYWLSIDGYKRGVRALASRSITVTAN